MPNVLNIGFVFPERELTAGFIDMKGRVTDLRDPFNEAADIFESDMSKQFTKEGRRPRWGGLSYITNVDRVGDGFSPDHPVLYREGTLRDSFAETRGEGHVREVGFPDQRGSEH